MVGWESTVGMSFVGAGAISTTREQTRPNPQANELFVMVRYHRTRMFLFALRNLAESNFPQISQSLASSYHLFTYLQNRSIS